MRVCNNSTPVPFLFHNSVHKVNQSVYKIKLFAKLHTASFRKTEIKKRVKKFTFLYFRHKEKCLDSHRGNEKGRPEGVALWLCVDMPNKSDTNRAAAILSVGVFDAADVTFLTAIVLKHEDS